MSYILDALNKSEQQRSRKKTPGLASLQEDGASEAKGGFGFLIALLALAAVSAAGFYYFRADSRPSEPLSSQAENFVVADEPETTAQAENIVSPIQSQRPRPFTVPKPSAPSQTDMSEQPSAPPALNITTHIYASDADLRLVNINGIERREGDIIGPSHRLIEITELGVRLEYRGDRYNLNIVDEWQTP